MDINLDQTSGIGKVADLASNVINKIWPDKSEQERQQMTMALTLIQGQIDTNKVEAGSDSLLKGGWRPATGWCCVSACAWNWVGLSMCKAIAVMFGKFDIAAQLVPANISEMLPILIAMLGLGVYRSAEKMKGVA